MTFRRTPPAVPDPEPRDAFSPAAIEARVRLEAARWKEADPADLVHAVRAEAQRLYAPTGSTPFPSRHEFNSFAGMVLALCDHVPAPERVAHDLADLTDGAVVLDETGRAHQLADETWLTVGDEREATPDTPVTVLREGSTR